MRSRSVSASISILAALAAMLCLLGVSWRLMARRAEAAAKTDRAGGGTLPSESVHACVKERNVGSIGKPASAADLMRMGLDCPKPRKGDKWGGQERLQEYLVARAFRKMTPEEIKKLMEEMWRAQYTGAFAPVDDYRLIRQWLQCDPRGALKTMLEVSRRETHHQVGDYDLDFQGKQTMAAWLHYAAQDWDDAVKLAMEFQAAPETQPWDSWQEWLGDVSVGRMPEGRLGDYCRFVRTWWRGHECADEQILGRLHDLYHEEGREAVAKFAETMDDAHIRGIAEKMLAEPWAKEFVPERKPAPPMKTVADRMRAIEFQDWFDSPGYLPDMAARMSLAEVREAMADLADDAYRSSYLYLRLAELEPAEIFKQATSGPGPLADDSPLIAALSLAAAADPDSALAALKGSGDEALWDGVLAGFPVSRAQEVFDALDHGNVPEEWFAAWWERLAYEDGPVVLQKLERFSEENRESQMPGVFRAWALRDPAAAHLWIETNGKRDERDYIKGDYETDLTYAFAAQPIEKFWPLYEKLTRQGLFKPEAYTGEDITRFALMTHPEVALTFLKGPHDAVLDPMIAKATKNGLINFAPEIVALLPAVPEPKDDEGGE